MAAEPNFIDGLLSQYEDLLGLTDAEGAAIVWDDQISTIGKVPPREEIETISNWLVANSVHDDVFVTNQASLDVAGAGIDAEAAAGMLAVSISQLYPSYIMWFRPEVVRTVRWGGDPRKSENPATGSLNPRKSFDLWRETVRHQAIPWTTAQVEAAGSLRSAIVGIVMRKAEEMAAITEELRRSNKELEAFSYSISHDLRAPFRHIVGFAELLKEILPAEEDPRPARYIETIIESAHSAGRLVDDLLGFSQVGRAQLTKIKVDMNKVVADALRTLQHEMEDRQINWKIDDLAPAMADPTFMRSVWQNLLANSIKYSRGTDPTTIEVTSTTDGEDTVFSVRDDGVGFDMAYVDKLFGVFQRLHRIEDYEGSGIGLANVKRIVERHGGRVWAEGLVGKGAVFYFALPKDVAGAS
jgi:light-regulated signal transduction histidine kinase (bacteriophytochrome)